MPAFYSLQDDLLCPAEIQVRIPLGYQHIGLHSSKALDTDYEPVLLAGGNPLITYHRLICHRANPMPFEWTPQVIAHLPLVGSAPLERNGLKFPLDSF